MLKENARSDIIKTILGYLLIVVSETLKKWKIVITSVVQEYKSTKSRYNYRTETEITYRGKGVLMEIEKFKDNYNKDRKPRCFNYNIYEHMAKDCWKLKKEKEIRKYYKYNKVGYLEKDCRSEQNIKNRSIQKDLDNDNNDEQESFVRDLK